MVKESAGCGILVKKERECGLRIPLSPHPPTPPPCTTYPSRPSTHWPREKLKDSIRATRAREGCTISEFPAVIEESLSLNYPVSHILFFGTKGKKVLASLVIDSILTRDSRLTWARGWLLSRYNSPSIYKLPQWAPDYRSSQRFKKFKQVICP